MKSLEELKKEQQANYEDIKRIENLIEGLNQQRKNLLSRDTDLTYKIMKIEDPETYDRIFSDER